MNDKDRDRCGDEAGPVADNNRNKPYKLLCGLMMLCFLALPFFSYTSPSHPYHLKGLSLNVGIGVLKPSDFHANFYNGSPDNVNTLLRILHSESYGIPIWNNLTNQDLIGSSVGSYNQLTVAEYGDMYYRLAIQLGIGFRYDLEGDKWAWALKFDYAKLNAIGAVLLNSGHASAYLTDQNRYVVCPTQGVEERIYFDLGIIRKIPLSNGLDLELAAGGNLNNTKVESSDIQIAGITYSILDIWGGQSPSSYVASYEYVNQGGIGYGAFASIGFGYTLAKGTAVSINYTFHYNRVNLQGYDKAAPHHTLRLNIAVNNFSLF
ncbi:MAG: hypothetical protein J6Y98_02515 [Bacteroidales bacterium]|nr:hypothetical protein [Bacteroidales bacterium]